MRSMFVSGISSPGLVLLGIAVLASLHLFYRDRPEGEDPLHLMMTVMGRVMIVTGLWEASFIFLNIMLIPFSIVILGILAYVLFRYWLRRRLAFLSVLAAAARRWMPLAPAAEAFAEESRGIFGGRCRVVAQALAASMPLGEALRLQGPLIPRRALAVVEVGVRTHNLSGALAEAARQPATQPVMARVWAAIWYLAMLVFVGTSVLTFMAIKIVPAFVKIFDDFDSELPAMTINLIYACDWFVSYGWPPLLFGLFGIACFALLWTFDVIAWLPPPLSTLSRRRETAVVLRALAVATEADRPVELAMSALAEHYPSLPICGRLRRALAKMAVGQPWAEALADQGLLRRGELALVSSAQRVGNLTWALRDVADGIERRFALRLQRWLEVLLPILVLSAGAVVMYIIVALFVPLISLITKLL
jgi:type II secretory pathway component PulF